MCRGDSPVVVRVMDSKRRSRSVEQIVGALRDFERRGEIEIQPSIVSKSKQLTDQLLDADVLIVHWHALRPMSDGDQEAEKDMRELIEYLGAGNPHMTFIVYSRAFSDVSAGLRGAASFLWGREELQPPNLEGRIRLLPFRDEAVIPLSVAQNLEKYIKELV